MSLHNVTPGANAPDEFNVIIEIPMNADPIKYEVDKESGAMFVDRFMSTAMHYPCNYGYVPQTLSDDGDPVDVLVITPFPLAPGVVVTCRPIGVLKMEDEAGGDAKLLAVPIDKILPIYSHWQKPADMNELRLKQIQHFFEHYKDLEPGKWVKVSGWEGPDAARAEVGAASPATRRHAPSAPEALGRIGSGAGLSAGLERPPFVQLVEVALDAGAFAREEIVDRARELRMREPVRRPGLHRQQAARHLVLALRAAFEAQVAVGDAPGERLVVAGVEVQAAERTRPRPSSGRTRSCASGRSRSASWRCARRRARR